MEKQWCYWKKNYGTIEKLWYYGKKLWYMNYTEIYELQFTKENLLEYQKTKKIWFIMKKKYGYIPKHLNFFNKGRSDLQFSVMFTLDDIFHIVLRVKGVLDSDTDEKSIDS